MDMINVKINGNEYSVPKGSTILDADTHDAHQTPDVVCCNQRMAQKLFE